MFGYLKLDPYANEELKRYYKYKYCLLCRALEKYYGQLPRFTLSYDVTFLMIFLDAKKNDDVSKKIYCIGKNPLSNTENDIYEKIASFSVILSYEKLKDDVIDENKFYAKVLMKLMKPKYKKASSKYPLLAENINSCYLEFRKLEKNSNTNIYDLCDSFSHLMYSSFKILFDDYDLDEKIIKSISSWIYFIDALDDIEKDVKKGNYNPFKMFGNSLKEIVNNHFDEIASIYKKIMNIYPFVLKKDSLRDVFLMRMINYSLPYKTYSTIRRRAI